MTDTRKVLEVLREAREHVAADWGTRNLDVPLRAASGSACASVAITIASDGDEATCDAAHIAFLHGAGVEIPEGADVYGAVYRFNDAQSSRVPVLAAFDAAVSALDELEPTALVDATDTTLEIIGLCERAGAAVARQVVAEHPGMDVGLLASAASSELFAMAQNVAQEAGMGAWS